MQSISSKGFAADRTALRIAIVVLIAGYAASLNLYELGRGSLQTDESIYALVAYNAVADGSWYPLYLDRDQAYLNKPPLVVLPLVVSFKLFGVSEFAARLPSALAGVALVLATLWVGARVAGFAYGALAAFILASTPTMLSLHGVREGVPDPLLSLGALLCLAFYARARLEQRGHWLVWASLALAAGLLSKGPFVPVAFLVSAMFWETTNRRHLAPSRPRDARRGGMDPFVPAIAVFAAAMAGYVVWLAYNLVVFPKFSGAVYADIVTRNLAGLDPGHLKGAWFYPRVLYDSFGAWLLALPLSVWAIFANRTPGPGGLLARLLFCWTAVVLIATSLSVSKLTWYVYPSFAPLAILIVLGLRQGVACARRLLPRPVAAVATALLIAVPSAISLARAVNAVGAPPRVNALHALRMLLHEDKEITLVSLRQERPGVGRTARRVTWGKELDLKLLEARPAHDTAGSCRVLVSDEKPYQADEAADEPTVLIVRRIHPLERNLALIDACGGRILPRVWRATEPLVPDSNRIDFSRQGFPRAVARVENLGHHEPWGRWSVADQVVFTFDRPLPARFDLAIKAWAFGPNAGRDVVVRVGAAERSFKPGPDVETHVLHFETDDPARTLKFEIPQATSPRELGMSEDFRRLGLGFISLEITPRE